MTRGQGAKQRGFVRGRGIFTGALAQGTGQIQLQAAHPRKHRKTIQMGGGGREAAAPFFKHEGRGRRREKGCTAHHCHLAARETERYKLRKKIIFSTTPLRGDLQIVAVGAT